MNSILYTFRSVFLVARREFVSMFTSASGFFLFAGLLFLSGWAFNGIAMRGEKSSFDVLTTFFFYSCGFVAAAGILFSMRLFAEEKQTGTFVFLQSSPLTSAQLVLGKYLGGLSVLFFFIATTAYLPLLISVHGHVSPGHIFVGYLGLFLEGAAVMAVGTFASVVAPHQLGSAVLSSVCVVTLFVCWLVAARIDGSLADIVGYLDFYDRHFRSFSRGIWKLSSTTYFLSIAYVGLVSAIVVTDARRWTSQ